MCNNGLIGLGEDKTVDTVSVCFAVNNAISTQIKAYILSDNRLPKLWVWGPVDADEMTELIEGLLICSGFSSRSTVLSSRSSDDILLYFRDIGVG